MSAALSACAWSFTEPDRDTSPVDASTVIFEPSSDGSALSALTSWSINRLSAPVDLTDLSVDAVAAGEGGTGIVLFASSAAVTAPFDPADDWCGGSTPLASVNVPAAIAKIAYFQDLVIGILVVMHVSFTRQFHLTVP